MPCIMLIICMYAYWGADLGWVLNTQEPSTLSQGPICTPCSTPRACDRSFYDFPGPNMQGFDNVGLRGGCTDTVTKAKYPDYMLNSVFGPAIPITSLVVASPLTGVAACDAKSDAGPTVHLRAATRRWVVCWSRMTQRRLAPAVPICVPIQASAR